MPEKNSKIPDHIHTLAIEGVIGAGKTELCKILAERLNARIIFEEAEDNPFLSKFYKNRSNFAFQTQLWFLVSRYKQLSESLFQQDLFHEMTVTDYLFDKDKIFASINLDENEFGLYNTVAGILEKDIPKLDYVVYLQATTDVLLKRIEKRARPYEFNMDYSYIDTLNKAYNNFFFHYSDSPLLIINTANIDFVENADDREELIEQILDMKPGSNYYQPLGSAEYSKIIKKAKPRGDDSVGS